MGNRAAQARIHKAAAKTEQIAQTVEQKWDQAGAALWVLNRRTKRLRLGFWMLVGMWLVLFVKVLAR